MDEFVIKSLLEDNQIFKPSPIFVEKIRFILANILTKKGISDVKIEVFAGIWYTQFKINVLKFISESLVKEIYNDIKTFLVSKSLTIDVYRKENKYLQLETAIPNTEISFKGLKEIIDNDFFYSCKSWSIGDGLTIDNIPYLKHIGEYANTNILVYGSTWEGSNNFNNTAILSLFASKTLNDFKLVFMAKRESLDGYDDLNIDYSLSINNLTPQVITNQDYQVKIIEGLVKVIDERFKLFLHYNVKTIKEFNEKLMKMKLSHIVIIVNDYDILYKQRSKEISFPIARALRYGSLVGVHLIINNERIQHLNLPEKSCLEFSTVIDGC